MCEKLTDFLNDIPHAKVSIYRETYDGKEWLVNESWASNIAEIEEKYNKATASEETYAFRDLEIMNLKYTNIVRGLPYFAIEVQ